MHVDSVRFITSAQAMSISLVFMWKNCLQLIHTDHQTEGKLDNFDLDENYIQTINSKYVDLPNFAKLYSSSSFDKVFSLFLVNTRSLSKNFGQL